LPGCVTDLLADSGLRRAAAATGGEAYLRTSFAMQAAYDFY
jgi:hypothetical protein